MSTKEIDIVNIGLMFLALFLAFRLPFELFLFSYVVLGPLHYLTEISWLKEKNYFVNNRKWIWVFIFLCLTISAPAILRLPIFSFYQEHTVIKHLSGIIRSSYANLILIMFLFAIGLACFKKGKYVLLSLLLSVIAGVLIIKYVPFSIVMVGIFLPTIIHVYLFTLLFMISGALNTKSKAGIIGSITLLICPLLIFTIRIDLSDYLATASSQTSYIMDRFSAVSSYIAHILKPLEIKKFYLGSEIAIRIQIFIAFCYTYHYLNWFSKTSVIGWNKNLSKTKLALILALWSASLLLYWYDYKTGYIALFFFSLLHVTLEFPLNIASVKGIISKVIYSSKAPQVSK